MFEKLKEQGLLEEIHAVGASTRPRAVEGSYMRPEEPTATSLTASVSENKRSF